MAEKKLPLHRRLIKKRKYRILLSVLLVLLAIRIALPFVILRYANRELNKIPGYRGHIEDVDLALIRGAYTIDDIYLNKKDTVTGKESEFFRSDRIDLSIEWAALFSGEISGKIKLINPKVQFIKDKIQPKEVSEDTTSFREVIKDLMPLDINRFEVKNGTIRYLDEFSKPNVDLQVKDIQIVAENLTNKESEELLPASARMSASVYDGDVNLNLKMNPLAKQTTFDMNAKINGVQLNQMNSLFKAYGKLDINKGTFGLYAEAAAKSGKFVGYVKPIIKDLDVLGAEDRDDKALQKMWEAIAGAAGEVFSNQKADQVATKIPFEGRIDKPDTRIWYAVFTILRNAFIQALKPQLDNEINIRKAEPGEEVYEKVFDKIGKKDNDKEDKKKNGDDKKNGVKEEGKKNNGKEKKKK